MPLLLLLAMPFSAVACSGSTSSADSLAAIPVVGSGGSASTIGDYLGDRPLLISLWAVWCQPCRRELPELADIAADPSAGVDVLALNIGDDQGRIDDFLSEIGVDVPVAVDVDGVALEALDAATVPVTVMLGVDGEVVWNHMGAVTRDEIDAALAGM